MPLRRALGRLALAALLCSPAGSVPDPHQRAPVLESVDLFIPMAPQTVRIAGRTHIVYELHITNFLLVDAAITRIQVTREGSPDAPLADYRDGDLRSRIGRRFEQLGAFSSIGALIGGERYLAEPGGNVNERRLERPGANSVIRFR